MLTLVIVAIAALCIGALCSGLITHAIGTVKADLKILETRVAADANSAYTYLHSRIDQIALGASQTAASAQEALSGVVEPESPESAPEAVAAAPEAVSTPAAVVIACDAPPAETSPTTSPTTPESCPCPTCGQPQ